MRKRIAIDAMGGDHAPDEILKGVASAIGIGHIKPEHLILVGDRQRIEPFLETHPELAGCALEHASQVVEMGEKAADAFRQKKDSSIFLATELVRRGDASAVLSAGDTGIAVACGILQLKQLPGVRRPGIGVTIHSAKGPCTLMDVGANVQAKPQHLFQYGVMASTYSQYLLGVENPRIGLLSVGAEESKGNDLVRQAREMFEASDLNFVGNIEGQDVFTGRCDVIVCDGFVGNVVLKVAEGMGGMIRKAFTRIRSHLEESGSSTISKELHDFMSQMDYAEYGGAPLLGVEGLVVICHGRSDARAISNAVRMAHDFVDADVNGHIRSTLAAQAGGGPPVTGRVSG